VATTWYANLNYICNERCVFCAAGLADGPDRGPRSSPHLSLEDLRRWMGEPPPAGDDVQLAGGEPTLHPDLGSLARFARANGADVVLFTNAVRFADETYAAAIVTAGVTRFEVAVYGASEGAHDRVTRRKGSLAQTLAGLRNLVAVGDGSATVVVRLLVSAQCAGDAPGIVDLVAKEIPGLHGVNLNPLILSDDAARAQAQISYDHAHDAVNEAVTRARRLGLPIDIATMPLCIFDGENAALARRTAAMRARRRLHEPRRGYRYLDPYVAAGQPTPEAVPRVRRTADACRGCAYAPVCDGVEHWYVEQFGDAGLRTVPRHRVRSAG